MRPVRSAVVPMLVCACGGAAALAGPMPVRNVELTVEVPSRCVVGACDPYSTDRTTLALIRVVNRGPDTSYIAMCGSDPAYAEQDWINGRWQFTGPAAACVSGPPSMALAPGDSLRTNWWPPKGVSRMTLGVGSTGSLHDVELDASNAVRIR